MFSFGDCASLSTESFLSCLHCFVSQRGISAIVNSDRSTSFVRAERYFNLSDIIIANYVADENIRWKFNSPGSPHWGSIEEMLLNQLKHISHLLLDIKSSLWKIFSSGVETVLNSRPSAYRDTKDQSEVMIPGHFLTDQSPPPHLSNYL